MPRRKERFHRLERLGKGSGAFDAFTVPVGATVGKELFHSLGSYRRKTSSCKNFRVQKHLDSRRLCAKAPESKDFSV